MYQQENMNKLIEFKNNNIITMNELDKCIQYKSLVYSNYSFDREDDIYTSYSKENIDYIEKNTVLIKIKDILLKVNSNDIYYMQIKDDGNVIVCNNDKNTNLLGDSIYTDTNINKLIDISNFLNNNKMWLFKKCFERKKEHLNLLDNRNIVYKYELNKDLFENLEIRVPVYTNMIKMLLNYTLKKQINRKRKSFE